MTVVDFLIGLTLVNSIPHFALGVWKGRMLSGFGFGDRANIGYGMLNLGISVTLFLVNYGLDALLENGIYLGGLTVVVLWIALGKTLHRVFGTS